MLKFYAAMIRSVFTVWSNESTFFLSSGGKNVLCKLCFFISQIEIVIIFDFLGRKSAGQDPGNFL